MSVIIQEQRIGLVMAPGGLKVNLASSQGPQGVAGADGKTGPQGIPGPNFVTIGTTGTDAPAGFLLSSDGSKVQAAPIKHVSGSGVYFGGFGFGDTYYFYNDFFGDYDPVQFSDTIVFPAGRTITGQGTGLTLNASKLIEGTVPSARLPTASDKALGGIRIGSGWTVDENGIASVTGGGPGGGGPGGNLYLASLFV